MKKTLMVLALAATSVAGYSQVTNVPFISSPIYDFLQKSNLIVATYGIVDTTSKHVGGGVALAYKLSEFIVPTIRMDAIDGKIWQPQMNLQIQAPVTLFGKLTFIPFVFDGIATPVMGKGAQNFQPINIAGVGAAVQFPKSDKWYVPSGAVGDFERWTGAGWNNNQIRAGVYWKF